MSESFSFDVFLSHSSKDKAVVRAVAERLRADDLKVWFDEWIIKPGDSIPAKIEEGLEQSRVLVFCMSANAFGSDYAQLETGTFRFRDPLNKDRRFIPLRLDDAPIKGSLAQFLYIDWTSAERGHEYQKLLEACRPLLTRPVEVILSQTSLSPTANGIYQKEIGVALAVRAFESLRQSACNFKAVSFKGELYVDRGTLELFLNYLTETRYSVFPIFGQAGIGKSWEMAHFIQNLPKSYIPLFISARLTRSFVDAVARAVKQVLQLPAPADQGILDVAVRSLPQGFHLVVFLDGINEYHFPRSDADRIKTDLWELFTWLMASGVKAVVSCRSFTWQRIFADEGFRHLMYVSGEVVAQRQDQIFDPIEQDFKARTYQETRVDYGAELKQFSDDQRAQFWNKVALQLSPKGSAVLLHPLLYGSGDPFLCGIRAKQMLNGERPSMDTFATLVDYVAQRCQDKGSYLDRDRRHRSLLGIAACFINDALELETFVPRDRIEAAFRGTELEELINTGLIRDDLASDGEQVIVFSHDRVMEYAVGMYLWRKQSERKNSIAESACFALQLAQKSSAENEFRDYYLNVGRYLLYKCTEHSSLECCLPSSVSEAFFLVREVLRRVPISHSVVCFLVELLDSSCWGYDAAILIAERASIEDLCWISQRPLKPERIQLVRNVTIVVRKLEKSEAIQVLSSASAMDDWVVRVRVAFACGEVDATEMIGLMTEWVSTRPWEYAVVNACLWAFEQMGHVLGNEVVSILMREQENHWRVARYLKALYQKDIVAESVFEELKVEVRRLAGPQNLLRLEFGWSL